MTGAVPRDPGWVAHRLETQSLLLSHVRGSRLLPRSVSQGWQGSRKAVQKDILLSLHIFCMFKYLWPRHTWHIKKYYTLEECWKKVIRQCSAHFEKQMLLIQLLGAYRGREEVCRWNSFSLTDGPSDPADPPRLLGLWADTTALRQNTHTCRLLQHQHTLSYF